MRYFRHLVDAHNDIKIRKLISRHGATGYSVYWLTLELIGKEGSEGRLYFHKLSSSDVGEILTLPASTVEMIWKEAHDLMLLCYDKDSICCHALVDGYSDEWSNRKRKKLLTDIAVAEAGSTVAGRVEKYMSKHGESVKDILSYLNIRTGKQYRWQGKDNQLILVARLQDGYSVDDLKKVVDNMCERWLGDERMEPFLRPSTLFQRSKIEGYLNIDKGIAARLRKIKDEYRR